MTEKLVTGIEWTRYSVSRPVWYLSGFLLSTIRHENATIEIRSI